MISLKDIAKQIGVSPSTVSFVLNGKAKQMRISDGLAKKIRDIARREGYQPNQVAVGLRTGQTKTIGLIVEDISNSFFASLAKTVEQEAKTYGYKVVYCSTDNDLTKAKELLRMLHRQQVDGYLITPVAGIEADIKRLLAQGRPVVLMDRYIANTNAPCVLVDNYSGMQLGVTHLLEKGYQSVGLVTVDLDMVPIVQREKAFRETFEKNKIPFRKKNMLRLRYELSRTEAVQKINEFIKKNKDFDAVVFTTNYLGIYGLQSIRELGLRMPDDVAMLCFDDHDIFDFYNPGITVIQQPIEEIAKAAVELLMKQCSGEVKKIKNNQVLLAAKMLQRGST